MPKVDAADSGVSQPAEVGAECKTAAALGLAALLLTCKVAHRVRLSCKSLYSTADLLNRCTFAAGVAEHSSNALEANDRDISFDEPDEDSSSSPPSTYFDDSE